MPNTHSLSAEHRRHDRLLVARFAVGDAAFGQEHEAQELVSRCSECAALAADIAAISKSVARMPAPSRSRDFRLTTEQADQLRGSILDRWLRTITGSGWTMVRPVAGVALSIGLVMSVVGFLPVLGSGNSGRPGTDALQGPVAGGQPTPESSPGGRNSDVPVSAPSAGPSELGPGQQTTDGNGMVSEDLNNAYLDRESPAPGAGNKSDGAQALPGTGSNVRDLILLSGLAVTIAAMMMLALLYAARRRYYDPLLR